MTPFTLTRAANDHLVSLVTTLPKAAFPVLDFVFAANSIPASRSDFDGPHFSAGGIRKEPDPSDKYTLPSGEVLYVRPMEIEMLSGKTLDRVMRDGRWLLNVFVIPGTDDGYFFDVVERHQARDHGSADSE